MEQNYDVRINIFRIAVSADDVGDVIDFLTHFTFEKVSLIRSVSMYFFLANRLKGCRKTFLSQLTLRKSIDKGAVLNNEHFTIIINL